MDSVSQAVLATVGAGSKPSLPSRLLKGDVWDGGRTQKAAVGSPLAPLHALESPLPIWQERRSASTPERPTPSLSCML